MAAASFSALDPEAAAVLALELDQAPHHRQLRHVLLAAEGAQHPREVARGGHRGAEAAADRLADHGAPEVVVAARTLREGHDLHLGDVGGELDDARSREV